MRVWHVDKENNTEILKEMIRKEEIKLTNKDLMKYATKDLILENMSSSVRILSINVYGDNITIGYVHRIEHCNDKHKIVGHNRTTRSGFININISTSEIKLTEHLEHLADLGIKLCEIFRCNSRIDNIEDDVDKLFNGFYDEFIRMIEKEYDNKDNLLKTLNFIENKIRSLKKKCQLK